MSVITRVQPIDRDLIIRLTGSPEERSAEFAEKAREILAETEARNAAAIGHTPPHVTIVDGVRGASEDQVKPEGGVIVYEFELVSDALEWIEQQLEMHSPVGSGRDPHPGRYQKSHILFADGEEVPAGTEVPLADEYIFANAQPYARKIENVEGVYEAVAALARGRFGNQARIVFIYFSMPSGAVGEWAKSASAQRHAARYKRHGAKAGEWLTRQPAIAVSRIK